MQKTLLVFTAAAGIGLAAMVASAADVRPGGRLAADLARSPASGLILGSRAWLYGSSPVPPAFQSMQSVWFAGGDRHRQKCDIYGLAAATFVDWQASSAETE
jgi:hypothetical protein